MKASKGTTKTGFVNPHGQVVIRKTDTPGTDHGQMIYQLGCSQCGHVYGANGTDIFQRKCPAHQGGAPGLPLGRSHLRPSELLALHAQMADELRARGITRSYNNPTGDLAEYLFCKAFGWMQTQNSNAHIDALAPDGTRYQIKGRRITRYNNSRQLSAIRNLDGSHFDFLAGVLFDENYSVLRAAVIPCSVAAERSTFVGHTNSYKFLLRDDVWDSPGVRDVTAELRSVEL